MTPSIAFIGLGVMGQRMLSNMQAHGGYKLCIGWDPDETACARTKAAYPHMRIAATPAEAIAEDEANVVYIASPPAFHQEHVMAALEAGKAVWCEKPLGVDIAQSRAMVDAVEASGLVNAINFPFSKAIAIDSMLAQLKSGALGAIAGADLRLHFSSWPRDWQKDAARWLSLRVQGGMTREVVSHYMFLTERLFGKAKIVSSHAAYPDGVVGTLCETHLLAQLDCAGMPVSFAASVGGAGPDLVEYTVWGAKRSLRLYDWSRLFVSEGGDWREELTDIPDKRRHGYMAMLDNFAGQLAGKPHSMASFREALSVQELIEAML